MVTRKQLRAAYSDLRYLRNHAWDGDLPDAYGDWLRHFGRYAESTEKMLSMRGKSFTGWTSKPRKRMFEYLKTLRGIN